MRKVYMCIIPSRMDVGVMTKMLDKIADGYVILSAVATHDAVQYILVKEDTK